MPLFRGEFLKIAFQFAFIPVMQAMSSSGTTSNNSQQSSVATPITNKIAEQVGGINKETCRGFLRWLCGG
jgi:hypothetical protein